MSFLGIPDPMIWLSYVGCVACVALCLIWGHIREKGMKDDDE